MELTDDEIRRIRYWEPYRDDWLFDRFNMPRTYMELRSRFSKNCQYYVMKTQDGGMGNYLEYVCYAEKKSSGNNLPALLICVSLCAPVAAYSEISSWIMDTSSGWGFLDISMLNTTTSAKLKAVEENALEVLRELNIEVLDKRQLQQPIPTDLLEGGFDTYTDLDYQELLAHAIFQWYV